MWRILQHSEADDFVLATGETHSVREFCERSFEAIGVQIEWTGEGVDEIGRACNIDREMLAAKTGTSEVNIENGQEVVAVDPGYFRPTEVELLLGDATKAKSVLGWQSKTTFAELVKLMVTADIEFVRYPNLDY